MSALTLERLLFDPAAVADGPSVGAYIVSASGNVIDDSNITGALDVYVANTLDIQVQLDHTDGDSVQIGDGTDLLAVNVDGSINAVVSATQLDIDDLNATDDNVAISDGTDTLAVNADGSINVQASVSGDVADDAADSGNPIKVGSRAHDASAALSALSADGDRADLLSDLYRRVFINDAPNVAVDATAVSVGTTAVALPQLAGRTRVLLQNKSSSPMYIGPADVTSANGIEVSKGGTLALEAGEAIGLYAISTAAAQDLRVFELA